MFEIHEGDSFSDHGPTVNDIIPITAEEDSIDVLQDPQLYNVDIEL